MKISSIELFHVQVPLKQTFWPTWIPGYPQTHNGFTLIKLVTDDGIEGYSAGTALGFEREGLGDLIGSYLLGADPSDIDSCQSLNPSPLSRQKTCKVKVCSISLRVD